MSERPEWLTEGATVAEFSWRGGASAGTASVTTVERFTKTQVVLANGNRYRIDKLRRNVGTWAGSSELLPIDDPHVVKAVVSANIERAAYAVTELMRAWRNGDEDARTRAIEILEKRSVR